MGFNSHAKDDHFGKSPYAQIKTFALPGQNGTATIDHQNRTISVPIFDTIIDFNMAPSELTISNFASVSPGKSSVQDFKDPVEYTVTAENGTKSVYTVSAVRTGNTPQLDNSSFEDWYQESVFDLFLDRQLPLYRRVLARAMYL